MSQPAHTTNADPFAQARARWIAAQSSQSIARASAQPSASPPRPARATDLPAALQADLQALRAAGLDFAVLPVEPTQQPAPRPARTITAAEVASLDARDPRRTLYQYQRAYAALCRPVPQHIVDNLRAAARDDAARRRISPRGE